MLGDTLAATARVAHFLALARNHGERAARTMDVERSQGHLKLADGYEATARLLQEEENGLVR